MNTIAYVFLVFGSFALAGAADWAWLRFVRPSLAARYGWRDISPSEHIPPMAWVGAAVVATILFIWLPGVGAAVGF